jgi:transposase
MERSVYRQLKLLARRRRAPLALVQRARIVLGARDGRRTVDIAREVGVDERTVRAWKSRFEKNPTIEGLLDGSRSGRPPELPVWVRCKLVQLACERPLDAPFREVWTHQALADELWVQTGYRVSSSEVARTLRFGELRPHRVRQWLHSPDPDFDAKASALCELYLAPPAGALVVCVDEKPMQALERRYPTRVGRGGVVRYEYEYIRHGVAALLGAFDTATGEVFGRVVPRRTGEALVEFMDELARRHPKRAIYVVWDNLNIHYDGKDARWRRLNRRHRGRFRFVYTPIHASWMNQIEIWFSILQRRVLRYGSFASTDELKQAVEGFIDHWNAHERHPFRWTWRAEASQNRQREAV